jgi:hypothetical protein
MRNTASGSPELLVLPRSCCVVRTVSAAKDTPLNTPPAPDRHIQDQSTIAVPCIKSQGRGSPGLKERNCLFSFLNHCNSSL